MQHSDEVSGVLSRVIQSLCLLFWPHCSNWCWSPQLLSPADPGPFLQIGFPVPQCPTWVSVLSLVTCLEFLLELLFWSSFSADVLSVWSCLQNFSTGNHCPSVLVKIVWNRTGPRTGHSNTPLAPYLQSMSR